MINVVTGEPYRSRVVGPDKRQANLLKGLDRIGYPYVIRRALRSTKRLWVNGLPGLVAHLPRSDVRTVIGPNVFPFGWDVPAKARLDHALIIEASEKSVSQFLGDEGFRRCPARAWAGGIDTDEFRPPVNRRPGLDVLVYTKHRDPGELPGIIETLLRHDLRPSLLMYGKYVEDEYRAALAKAAFVVWHGLAESQGFALGEALSCDVPVLVCDNWAEVDAERALRLHIKPGRRLFENAPYFDDRCGLRIDDLDKLSGAVQEMLDRLPEFQPREYVLENLTLERSARAFVDLWQEWGLTFEEGLDEVCRGSRTFRLPWRVTGRQIGGAVKRGLGQRTRPQRF
jgi:glycosyltransferase involved in cell wall biosynthesis